MVEMQNTTLFILCLLGASILFVSADRCTSNDGIHYFTTTTFNSGESTEIVPVSTSLIGEGRTECDVSLQMSPNVDFLCTHSEQQQQQQCASEKSTKEQKAHGKLHRHWDYFANLYLELLESHTLLTKCTTAGLIALLGDILAQGLEYHMQENDIIHQQFSIHIRRAFGIFFESMFISGPIMHWSYDILEEKVPIEETTSMYESTSSTDDNDILVSSLRKWAAALFHVIIDLIILGPVFVLSMMVTSSFIEGRWRTIWQEFKSDFSPALWASTLSSLSFLPMQTVAFRLLSVKFRLLYMNLQDIIWNAVVSFMVHKSRK